MFVLRANKISRELNIKISDIFSFLNSNGYNFKHSQNTKIHLEAYELLLASKINEKKVMNYDNERNKVVGVIEKELGGNSAKIKALGVISDNNEFLDLSVDDAKDFFPPYGYLFEPGFFLNHNYKTGDIIQFWAEENFKSEGGYDKFKLKYKSNEVKSYGINTLYINGFRKTNLVACLEDISLEEDFSDGVFFGLTDKYVVGKLRAKKGIIEPALHHRIQIWDREEQNIIENDNCYRLLNEPIGDSITLDCMTDNQLFEWFRDLLKKIEPDFVKLLDKNASWRIELPKLFSLVDDERLEADKIRLKRIEEKFELISLTRQEIKLLVDNSEKLKETFHEVINSHKQEFKNGYKTELDTFEAEIKEQKDLLTNEVSLLEEQRKEKKDTVNQLTETIQIINNEIERLNKNKDRIIDDFSIIKDVLQGQNLSSSNTVLTGEQAWVIENIKSSSNLDMGNCKEFETELRFQLSSFNLNNNLSKKIIDTISIHNALLIKDIRIGVALAKATNNAKYIIQQVEPDWLHFKNFWNNALGAIWESAHNNPEICHFLILEDINMSAPECYCRPLMDVLVGIRTSIPFGKSNYPNNLKILATYISFEEPEIGLPMNKEIFTGWGAIGFKGDIYKNNDKELQTSKNFFKPEIFIQNSIDEFEKCEVENDVKVEFESIFE